MHTVTIWWHQLEAVWPNISWALGLLWFAYVILLGSWILLQKREPIATLSWLLSLALLPFIGFLIYHFLGPTRIKRHRIKRHRSKSNLMPLLDSNTSQDASDLMKLTLSSSDFAPSSASDIQLLVNGVSTFSALLQAFNEAAHHIHMEYYIFEADHTGTQIRDGLIVQAKRGIQVRLLLDRMGSKNITEKFLQPLRDAGVEIAFFHPYFFKRLWRPQINMRLHRKIVVIDGIIGFTGGINITDEENESVRADAYVDLHFKISGEIVRWLQLAFVEDWIYAGGAFKAKEIFWPAPALGIIPAQILAAGPDTPWEPIHRAQVFAINNARQRVLLVTPYFVPSDAALMALSSAALRGLEVVLIVPKRSDSLLVTLAARSYFDALSSAGVCIFEYPHMLHTKALLIDDDTVIVGSSNFDNRSFKLNFELSLLIEHSQVSEEVARIVREYIRQSTAYNAKAILPITARLAQAFARLFSPLL
jgi:cardiolipin synthase A/B